MKSKKSIPPVLLEICYDILVSLKNPDPWSKVLKQYDKQKSSTEINCPVCNKREIEIWYYIPETNRLGQKRKRLGDGWVGCKHCNTMIECHQVKFPDWYPAPNDQAG